MKSLKERLQENKKLKFEILSLFEQEDPNQMQDPNQQAAATPPPQTAAGSPPPDNSGQQPQDQQQNSQPQLDETGEPADQIISAINVIRSGRSFKDAPVKTELDKYLNDLDDKEKGILITFLKGLSQISSGQVPGEQAVEPADNGKYKVISSSGGTKIQVKPAGGGAAQPQSQEDTSAPTAAPPIAPKQR
jgi:hypothetical protein